MGVITQGPVLSDILAYEANNQYSRETITVASGRNLKMGQVIGLFTASGKAARFDTTKTDGTEAVYGVLLQDADATNADVKAVAVVRHAILKTSGLVWRAGTDIDAGTAQLEAMGVIVRDQA